MRQPAYLRPRERKWENGCRPLQCLHWPPHAGEVIRVAAGLCCVIHTGGISVGQTLTSWLCMVSAAERAKAVTPDQQL